MEDLIYILLGLVWVVFAIYRNQQKKKLREASKPHPESEETPLETTGYERNTASLFEEILLGQKVTVPAPEEDHITIWDQKENEKTWDAGDPSSHTSQDFEDEYNLAGITSVEEHDRPVAETAFSEAKDRVLEVEILDDDGKQKRGFEFDLKKAIIYSVILDRQYF